MVNPPITHELVDHDQDQQDYHYKYQQPFKRSIHLARSSGVIELSWIGADEMKSIEWFGWFKLRLNLNVLKLSEQRKTRQDLIGHIGIHLPFG